MSEPTLKPCPEWTVRLRGNFIYSDDFTHDVALKLTGDFADDAQREAYAADICRRLNATRAADADADRLRQEVADLKHDIARHIAALAAEVNGQAQALDSAFAAGAAAMREIAVTTCEMEYRTLRKDGYDSWACTADECAAAIRALPLPQRPKGE